MSEITCPVASVAAEDPDRIAIVTPEGEIAYADWHQRIEQARAFLSERSVSRGDNIALLGANSLSYITTLFALWRLGAVACPISPKLPVTEVREMMRLIRCDIAIDGADKLSFRPPKNITVIRMDDILDGDTRPDSDPEPILNLDQPATIIFTSGSSGFPKAARHRFSNHYYSALGSNENIVVEPNDRWLLSLPLYHVGGLAILFRTTLAGAAIVIPSDKTNIAQNISDSNVTHVSMIQTQLYRLLDQLDDGADLSALKALLLGGSAIPRTLARDAWTRGLPAYLSYGLTEMSSQVCTTRGEHAYSSGKPLKYREVSIADDGEILVRGEVLFDGYVDGDNIDPATDNDGWFHTGDVGEFDEDGNLNVIGRKDNMFISGGQNLYPEEIESALMEINEVVEAVVVPVKNVEFGYRPVAFVRTEPYREITREDCSHLPSFKIPIQFYDWPGKYEIPNVKLDRRHFHKLVKDTFEHF